MAIPSWKMMPALDLRQHGRAEARRGYAAFTYNLVQVLTEAGLPRGRGERGQRRWAGGWRAVVQQARMCRWSASRDRPRWADRDCRGVRADFQAVHLEMGGKNIIVVMDDANLDLAVDGAVWGGFGTTGQRCTAASRVAVHKSVYHEFVDEVRGRA